MSVQAASKHGLLLCGSMTMTYKMLLRSLCAIIVAILVHTKTACPARELPPVQS